MSVEHLKLLHTLIGQGIMDLEAAFDSRGFQYPSMQDPYQRSKSQELAEDDSLLNATNMIVAAADQLIASVRHPFATICDAAMSVSRIST